MDANKTIPTHKHAVKIKVVVPLVIFGVLSVTALTIAIITIFLFKKSGGPTGKQGAIGLTGPQGVPGKAAPPPGKDAFFTCPNTGEVPMNVDYGQSQLKGDTGWKNIDSEELADWLGSQASNNMENCRRYCNINENCAAYFWDPSRLQCVATSELTNKNYDSTRGIEVHCSGDAPKNLYQTGSWKNKYNPKYSIEGNDCKTTRVLTQDDRKKELGGDSPTAEDSDWIKAYANADSKCTSDRKTFPISNPRPWCYTDKTPPTVITPAPWGYVSDSQDCKPSAQ